MVLAVHGLVRTPIFGKLRFEATPGGVVTIVTPLNTDWRGARSDLEPVEVLAVMTESIRKG